MATSPTPEHGPFVTDEDEISLAESLERETPESVPDTLEVRSDAMSVMQASATPLRKIALASIAALAVGIVVIVLTSAISRGRAVATPVE